MSRLTHHLLIGWQNLRRTPIYVVTVVLTMGITLGALSSAFGLSYLLLLEPLPYPNSHNIFLSDHARIKDGKRIGEGFQSYPALLESYKNDDLLEEAALIQNLNKRIANLPSNGLDANNVFNVSFVTPEYFSLFGAQMIKGRAFTKHEGLDSQLAVAVISHDFWQRALSAVPDILEKTLLIDDVSFKIVGVMSPSFVEPKFDKTRDGSQVWLAWDFNVHNEQFRLNWTNFLPYNHLVGRLSEEDDIAAVNARGESYLSRRFEEETRGSQYWSQMRLSHHLRSLESAIIGDSKQTALLLFLGLLGVALLALSNITNLFISRLSQSQKQFAIKVSIGATPKQLFLSIFAEAFLLMFLALIFTILVYYIGISVTRWYGADVFPRLSQFRIHWVTILFIVFVNSAIAWLFTHFAVKSLHYQSLMGMMNSSGKGGALQISQKTRSTMVVMQIACAGVLLCFGVEVATRALDNLFRPLGFDIENTGMLRISAKTDDISSEELNVIRRQILSSLQSNPAIAQVSHANSSPLTAYLRRSTLIYDSEKQVRSYLIYGNDHYFAVNQINLISGNTFSQEHLNSKANVAVLSRSMAYALFPNMDIETEVIGKTVVFGSRRTGLTVVGVVEDTAHPSPSYDKKVLYLPPRQGLTFVLRKYAGFDWPASELHTRLASIDPRLQLREINPLVEIHADMLTRDRLLLSIAIILVVVSLALTMIGIYGAINYSIRLMRYELGVRMALGATPARVTLMITTANARSLLIGLGFSILIGISIFLFCKVIMAIEQPLTWTSPAFTLVIISVATLLSNALPITQQYRSMPARYLDR